MLPSPTRIAAAVLAALLCACAAPRALAPSAAPPPAPAGTGTPSSPPAPLAATPSEPATTLDFTNEPTRAGDTAPAIDVVDAGPRRAKFRPMQLEVLKRHGAPQIGATVEIEGEGDRDSP